MRGLDLVRGERRKLVTHIHTIQSLSHRSGRILDRYAVVQNCRCKNYQNPQNAAACYRCTSRAEASFRASVTSSALVTSRLSSELAWSTTYSRSYGSRRARVKRDEEKSLVVCCAKR